MKHLAVAAGAAGAAFLYLRHRGATPLAAGASAPSGVMSGLTPTYQASTMPDTVSQVATAVAGTNTLPASTPAAPSLPAAPATPAYVPQVYDSNSVGFAVISGAGGGYRSDGQGNAISNSVNVNAEVAAWRNAHGLPGTPEHPWG